MDYNIQRKVKSEKRSVKSEKGKIRENHSREKFAESPVAEKALTGAAAGKFL